MKVADLINRLQEFPVDSEVYAVVIDDCRGGLSYIDLEDLKLDQQNDLIVGNSEAVTRAVAE